MSLKGVPHGRFRGLRIASHEHGKNDERDHGFDTLPPQWLHQNLPSLKNGATVWRLPQLLQGLNLVIVVSLPTRY